MKEGAREGERACKRGSQREDFILFYSMFPFLGSFPHRLSPLPVRAPPKVALANPPTLPFILAVSCSRWGVWVPKAQGFARIREAQTAICLESGEGDTQHPHHPAKPPSLSQPLPSWSCWTEPALGWVQDNECCPGVLGVGVSSEAFRVIRAGDWVLMDAPRKAVLGLEGCAD